jgi:ATP-dependent Zn protease
MLHCVAVATAHHLSLASASGVQTLNQLLTEIDGFSPTQGVVFMAATNRAALLDPAIMRAGRFDRKISIPRPDEQARFEILSVHAKKHKLGESVDLRQLAADCPGLVGADLRSLLNEAALEAARRRARAIEVEDIMVCFCQLFILHLMSVMLSLEFMQCVRTMLPLAVACLAAVCVVL